LLVRHEYGNRHLWYLPGGAVKRKETLIEALRREVKEELSVDIRVERLHGVYYSFHHRTSDHISVFIASVENPSSLKPSWEIRDFAFFDPGDLPESTSPATRRRIKEYLSGAARLEYQAW
jgi:ADP-ribose pyrophosphatase YjhB (NUDIX family)